MKKQWDTYFHNICKAVASKSPCLSRKIGAILVRDRSVVSTGYNGPPRKIPHCGINRLTSDKALYNIFADIYNVKEGELWPDELYTTCPRKIMRFKSGEGMEWCTAQHAEENAVSNAARLGVSTLETTLYMNSVIPCSKCFGTLINAGVMEIVIEDTKFFDNMTEFIRSNSNILIRKFQLY